jgi:anaerobic magnesium-protoporphyrin IX monomethyl ester cyclase
VSGNGEFTILEAATASTYRRDTSRPIVLIGFLDQGNLGIGYLSSTLQQHGYTVVVFDVEQDPQEIAGAISRLDPLLIGFSLIFQFYVHRYEALARALREQGADCHFTMGGHFASLSSEATLKLVPQLDSVARFEGEYTLLELADCLSTGQDWRGVRGLVYRDGDDAVATPLRPLVEDLDRLPYPERNFKPEAILGRRAMPLLASRGCARTCSFCSIHTFYRAAPGKVVRTRKPAEVVREMRMLHDEHGITIFLFQDDDFPLFGPVWRRWAMQFVDELHRSGLPGRAIWKMNCRADAVDKDLFAALRDAGLYLVYMGLESGSEEGLRTLHKQITVAQNIRAVEILKSLGLMFEFGFMLFDPSTTFQSVRENIAFLRAIAGDGSAAATFCRMLPYDGTPIKDELERAGRLRGDVCNPDYDFLDPVLSDFYEELSRVVNVTGWIHGFRALSPQINWAWNEVAVLERLFPPLDDMAAYKDALRTVTRDSNEVLFTLVEDMARAYTIGGRHSWSETALEEHRRQFLDRLLTIRNGLILRNQPALLRALQPPSAAEAVYA